MALSQHIRITGPTLKVLVHLLESHPAKVAGSDIINRHKLFSGTLYPILDRLAKRGWIVSEWEKRSPAELKRPRKRLYSLTKQGLGNAESALKEHNILWENQGLK